jgi:hypothetical protein
MVKQLKNRYNDPTVNKRFVIGVDRAKMRLYDLEQSAQKGLSDSGLKISADNFENLNASKIFSKSKKDFSKIKV